MFFLKLISRLPFGVLYLISDLLYIVAYHLVRYRRKLVRKNLVTSFPEKSLSEIQQIEKAFYKNLCDYGVETLKLLTISREELCKRMVYRNFTNVERYKAANQSVILLAAHTFNWEWLLAAGNMQLNMNVDFVFQPQNSAFFNRLSLESRTRFGAYGIERIQVAKESFKRRHILRGIAIVADQYPGYKRDKKFLINFLNQETAFFLGANQLAQVMQYPAIFAKVTKVRRGYYEVVEMPISEPPYTNDSTVVVENYARAVEIAVRENPSGWLWSHNRWKKRHLTQASVQYPRASTAS